MTTNETMDSFYAELMNRFFHPESFFYLCISTYFKDIPQQINENDPSVNSISYLLVKHLTNSINPISELKEISLLNGFQNFSDYLINKLKTLDLKSVDRSQLKPVINKFAKHFIEKIHSILLEDPNRILALQSYLSIKGQLKHLFTNHKITNNSSFSTSLNEIGIEKSKTMNINQNINKSTNTQSIENLLSEKSSIDHNDRIQITFKNEMLKVLQKLNTQNQQLLMNTFTSKNIRTLKKIFARMQELSMFYGFEEIEAIAKWNIKLTDIIAEKNIEHNQQISDKIHESIHSIEKFINENKYPDQIYQLLNGIDVLIKRINEKNIHIHDIEEKKDNSQNTEVNMDIEVEQISIEKLNSTCDKNYETKTPATHEIDDNIKEENNFKIPGEDDNELLSLIEDISATMAVRNSGEITIIKSAPVENKIQEQEQSQNEDVTIKEVTFEEVKTDIFEKTTPRFHTSFHHEASLYFGIITNAINHLRSQEKIVPYLEDIELASSSLKQLAIKFGQDKLSLLPEIIESICMKANKNNQNLPNNIIDRLGESVKLLKIFDRNNKNHRKVFMTLLTILKKYYVTNLSQKNIT